MTIALTRVTVLSMLALLGGLSTNSCRAQAAEELATHDIAGQTGAEIDQPPLGPLPSYSWHIDSVPSHMQLITLVAEFPPTEGFHNGSEGVPLVSVLRDTLGDTDETNDRLRYIWLLTYARPTKMQRFFSAMPFFYRRISAGQKLPKGGVPKPLLDLSHTRKRVWTRLGGALAQWAAFNPQSMPIRTGTLAYRTNDVNGDRLHVEEAIHFLRRAPASGEADPLTLDQRNALITRLSLTKNLLGGLVQEEHLDQLNDSHQADWETARGRNWELLRSSAERSGLYFEPMRLDEHPEEYGVIWFPLNKSFRSPGISLKKTWKLLQVKDPWNDVRLKNWDGYRQLRSFDAGGALLPLGESGASEGYVAPLAVYSLTYSRQPLLLADFRSQLNAKWREVFQRSWDDLATGVFALSHFTNWYYFVGNGSYQFIRSRSGAANNSAQRLDSYADLRSSLALDRTLDDNFRKELEERLGDLAINPLESSPNREVSLARHQYTELLKAAGDPKLLPKLVDNDRREEIAAFGASPAANTRSALAHFLSLGIYKRRAAENPDYLAELDRQRRIASSLKFLSQVADAGPSPEVVFGEARIRESIIVMGLTTAPHTPSSIRKRASDVVARVKVNSSDEDLRSDCDRLLEAIRSGENAPVARNFGSEQKSTPEVRTVSRLAPGAQ